MRFGLGFGLNSESKCFSGMDVETGISEVAKKRVMVIFNLFSVHYGLC